jgi:uncharacterized membrane protein
MQTNASFSNPFLSNLIFHSSLVVFLCSFSYTSMVIDAMMDLNNPNGVSISEIASSIEV